MYFPDAPDGEVVSCGFCDASCKAYAAVVYLLIETPAGRYVRFVASKTRVATAQVSDNSSIGIAICRTTRQTDLFHHTGHPRRRTTDNPLLFFGFCSVSLLDPWDREDLEALRAKQSLRDQEAVGP